MSEAAYIKKYPTGKVPRKAKESGKVFICRRGCNTRTCTYTEDFIWEDIYHGREDVEALQEMIRKETKATRKTRAAKADSPDRDYKVEADAEQDGDYAPG